MPFTAALLLAAAATPLAPVSAMSAEDAVASLRQCGLLQVTAAYDEDLQEQLLTVADEQATEAQLECAASVALGSGYWVEVAEPIRERYVARYQRLSRERSRADARALLAAQGKLDTVPEYLPGETDDAAFARRLEALCGPDAEGALQTSYGPHVIGSTATGATSEELQREGDALICLVTYAAAAGFELGFLGNEVAAPR